VPDHEDSPVSSVPLPSLDKLNSAHVLSGDSSKNPSFQAYSNNRPPPDPHPSSAAAETNPHSISRLLNGTEGRNHSVITASRLESSQPAAATPNSQPLSCAHQIAVESLKPDAMLPPTPSMRSDEFNSTSSSTQSGVLPATNDLSTVLSSANAPGPAPNAIVVSRPADTLIDSLSKVPELYDLPTQHLELIVGRVIREEGFTKLLHNLDAMWKTKGLLEHM